MTCPFEKLPSPPSEERIRRYVESRRIPTPNNHATTLHLVAPCTMRQEQEQKRLLVCSWLVACSFPFPFSLRPTCLSWKFCKPCKVTVTVTVSICVDCRRSGLVCKKDFRKRYRSRLSSCPNLHFTFKYTNNCLCNFNAQDSCWNYSIAFGWNSALWQFQLRPLCLCWSKKHITLTERGL